ncbi:MAG: asparagine synthase (glutamine-hydrolyzing), partial [Pricia sp.]
MCGILGYFSERPIRRETFETMRDQMLHRGPDGAGATYLNGDRVALGHRRLSIIDLSDDGQQPMPNEDKTLWLTFNGEIYNHLELRKELKAAGHRFSSNMDGEVLIHGFETWGLDGLLQRVNGMFAFALYDEKTGQFHCARDRFGIKPFVYYHDGKRFLFASEIKAILKDSSLDRSIRKQSLADYFNYGYVPHPHTPWEHIKKLPPGHSLSFSTGNQGRGSLTTRNGQSSSKDNQSKSPLAVNPGTNSSKGNPGRRSPTNHQDLNIQRYYTLPTASNIIDRGEAHEISASLLKNAVEGHLTSDVPVGLFLSGGYDSTAVLHYTKELGHNLDSFTLGFANSKNSEHHLAKQIADIYETPNQAQVLQNEEDYWATLFHQSEFYDEPYAVSSMMPYYYVSQLAAKTHKVILGGDGGDEVYAGYRWHSSLHDPSFKGMLKNLIRGKHQRLLTNYNRHMNGLRKREEAFSVWKDDEIPALADASNLDYFRGN